MSERYPCPECSQVKKTSHGLSVHLGKAHKKRFSPGEVVDAALERGVLGKQEEESVKEIKVMVPLGYHVRLHGLKVVSGRTISQMVGEALDQYFQGLENKEREER